MRSKQVQFVLILAVTVFTVLGRIVSISVLLSPSVIPSSCQHLPDTTRLGGNQQKREVLVREARRYLQNCRDWFIPPWPPVFGGSNGSLRNESGAYPWADRNLGETRSTCNSTIYYATRLNQTNWNQYYPPLYPDAGWPDTAGGDARHKAGFACHALIAQALHDAGYEINPTEVYGPDWFRYHYSAVTGAVQVGDIVLYSFGQFSDAHAGIITDVSSGNQSQFSVVSSIAIVEHFSYGAAQKRLGIFGTSASGGDFTVWSSVLVPIATTIVRPQ